MKQSRWLKVLLSSLMALCLMAGTLTGALAYPEDDESVTVHFRILTSTLETPPEGNIIIEQIQKETNTEIEWITPPASEYAEKMQLMLAGGDYPDLVNIRPGDNWRTYAEQGIFQPLDDLLEYAPILTDRVEDSWWDLYKMGGQKYGVPRQNLRTPSNVFARVDWIEALGYGSDWEDTLGSEQFKSIDEWYEVLKGMKETYGASYTSMFALPSGLDPFFGAYGVMPQSNFYIEDNGEYLRTLQHPRMKDALTFVNKLYSEGLIDPEIATASEEQVGTKEAWGNTGMVYDLWYMIQRVEQDLDIKAIDENANWAMINPPMGPDGFVAFTGSAKAMDGAMCMSAKAENPIRLIKFMDYLRGDGYKYGHYGVEGVHYEWSEDGTERIVLEEGQPIFMWAATYALFREMFDPFWFYPYYGEYAEPLEDGALENPVLDNVAEEFDHGPVYKQYGADLERYEQEMLVKFITGEEPLDNWDAYVSECSARFHADEINEEILNGLRADGRIE